MVAGEEDEEERADDGEADDDEGPEETHFEVLVVVDDVEGDAERENDGKDGDWEEVAVEQEIEDDEDDDFGENTDDSPSKAIGEEAFEKAERVMFLWRRLFVGLLWRWG